MKIELLAGNGIKAAFKELGIQATRTYKSPKDYDYQVWEIEKSDLKKLENVTEWHNGWGWWRFAKGSNMGIPFDFFDVNGRELIAWPGARRDSLRDEWDEESMEEKEAYHYSFREYEKTQMPHSYDNLLEYCCNELGASTETNICALAVDLARHNGMSLADLFKTYLG